jgi:NADH:ubiquinone reductase (H+-translocating)
VSGVNQQVLIIGAGFAGLQAAKALARSAPDAKVLLIDRHNYHTFTPLLYQVATAAIEPEEIAQPVRSILHHERNVEFRVAEVSAIDLGARTVQTSEGAIQYDYLIAAAGSSTNFFNVQGAAAQSFGLKDLPQAVALRNHLLMQLERAAAETDPNQRRTLQTIVVVGGGPTGVELAGAIAELTRAAIVHDFPTLDPSSVRIYLVEAGARLLSTFRPRLSEAALKYFRHHGVEVMLHRAVQSVDRESVTLADRTKIDTATVVWAAGVEGEALVTNLSAEPARGNRVTVNQSLQLEGHPEVYVAGDMAALRQGGAVLPMLAPVAMQAGRQAGLNVARQMQGMAPLPFHYVDRGTMATLGRSHAVAQIGPITLTGYIAWLAWLALHLVELIGFRNRLLVLVNWIWDYLFVRGARIILD